MVTAFVAISCGSDSKPGPDEIWYTTCDGKPITLSDVGDKATFGTKILYNTYEDGKGVIVFDAPLFRINARPENGIYELNSDNTNGKNMHVITTVNDSYKTLVMDGIVEAQATGVEDVNINNNGNNIYYNLQGVKVANPSNGIFIKVDGTKAARVFVK